jgi:gliding-associated putative ABC transporter substrate-binding component GldG
MNTRQLKTQTLIRLGLVFVILIVLNFVSVRLFGRIDLTRNHLFSLSEASKTLMKGLDDRVTVRAYFTEDLPSPYNNNRRLLVDELNEYRAYSRGNLDFEFIDPSTEKAEQDAQQQGIAPVQVQVINQDKLEVKKAYMGLVFLYEDRKETIPVLENTSSLEYDISSTIKRLVTKTQKKIGFLSGQGEPPLSELTQAQQALQKQYQLVPVDLSKGKAVPDDITVLLVIAPTSQVPDPVKFQIDQYLMHGGRIAFLLNRVEASLQQQFGRPIDTGLDDMLASYGVRVNPDLVRDVQCANVSIMQQQAGFSIRSQVPFPYLPVVSAFDKGNMMVKDLQGIILFFGSTVDTVGLASKGLSGEVLFRSSKQSGTQTGVFTFNPLERWSRDQFPDHGLPLAVVVDGVFHSFYAGKPAPTDTAVGSLPPTASPLTQSPKTRIVVVGDGDFMKDGSTSGDNITFFANMVDYLADDAGLIAIRSKDVAQPPLEPISDGSKQAYKYINMILPPLFVLAYGLLRWRKRRFLSRLQ